MKHKATQGHIETQGNTGTHRGHLHVGHQLLGRLVTGHKHNLKGLARSYQLLHYALETKQGLLITAQHRTALHCTALQCTVLHCSGLHCTVLNCTTLYCTSLQCTAQYCTALYCTVLHCTALRCTALNCIVLHCNVLHCTSHTVELCEDRCEEPAGGAPVGREVESNDLLA